MPSLGSWSRSHALEPAHALQPLPRVLFGNPRSTGTSIDDVLARQFRVFACARGYPTIVRASAVFSTTTAVPSPWQVPRPRLLGSIEHYSLQGRIFSTSATSHSHSWVVANTSMLPFVVTVPPPWRAW